MSTLREAAQQVLEACTDAVTGWQSLAPLSVRSAAMESLDALRDALAQEDEMREMLRTLGFGSQCPESIGITLRRWRDGYAAALAQEEQEQEPVLTMNKMGSLVECSPTVRAFDLSDGEYKLYTHPPRREWQGLTEEEIKTAVEASADFWATSRGWITSVARAVERALKEKNV